MKSGGVFTCNLCNTRMTMLSKRFPGWQANSEFKLLDDAQQRQFWKDAGKSTNTAQLQNELVNVLVYKRVDVVRAKLSGQWLPLSVYRAQGFDADRIAAHCTDTKEHPVLGLTYRVQVQELARESCEEVHRMQVLKNLQKQHMIEPVAGNAADTTQVDAKGEEVGIPSSQESTSGDSSSSNTSSTSSSSSSSSSSEKHKKKKNKKHNNKGKKAKKSKKSAKAKKHKKTAKKDKNDTKEKKHAKPVPAKAGKRGNKAVELSQADRDKEKDREQQKTEQQKRLKDRRLIEVSCNKVGAKLAHPIFQLETTLKDKFIGKAAAFAVDAVKASVKEMLQIRTAAQKILKNANDVGPLAWSMDDINTAVKAAIANNAMVETMLAAARKCFRS